MDALTLTGGGGTMFVWVIEAGTRLVGQVILGGGQAACRGPGISPVGKKCKLVF